MVEFLRIENYQNAVNNDFFFKKIYTLGYKNTCF